MPETVHVASGKVREIYALDDERLLLVASDRISTFDVVLPTEIPDKGRVLTGLSAFWFARTKHIVPNHLLALRDDGRSTECRRLEMLPLECVVRGYITGSGWKDYLATGEVCGHRLPEGLRESERLPAADLHAVDEGAEGHDENITASRRPSSSAASASTRSSGSRSSCTASPRRTRRRAGSSWPTRSSSSASTTRGGSCSPTRRSRPIRPASGRPTRTSRAARSRRSTSSSCATTASRSAGTRRIPGPSCRTTSSSETRAKYVEAFERLTGIAFDEYVADPEVVLR